MKLIGARRVVHRALSVPTTMFRVVSCASWGGAYNDARVDLLSIVGTAAKKRAGSCSPWIPTALCVVGFRTLSSMWEPHRSTGWSLALCGYRSRFQVFGLVFLWCRLWWARQSRTVYGILRSSVLSQKLYQIPSQSLRTKLSTIKGAVSGFCNFESCVQTTSVICQKKP